MMRDDDELEGLRQGEKIGRMVRRDVARLEAVQVKQAKRGIRCKEAEPQISRMNADGTI